MFAKNVELFLLKLLKRKNFVHDLLLNVCKDMKTLPVICLRSSSTFSCGCAEFFLTSLSSLAAAILTLKTVAMKQYWMIGLLIIKIGQQGTFAGCGLIVLHTF